MAVVKKMEIFYYLRYNEYFQILRERHDFYYKYKASKPKEGGIHVHLWERTSNSIARQFYSLQGMVSHLEEHLHQQAYN